MFTNIFDLCLFAQLDDARHMYVELVLDRKKPYKLMHCWEALRDCAKWKCLCKDQDEGDERKLPAMSADRPTMGVKACKAAARAGKKTTASSCSIQESMQLYVSEVSAAMDQKKLLFEAAEKKWNTFFKMQQTKLKDLAKKEERLYMATNTSDMSPNQKAYFVAERRRIQAEKTATLDQSEEEGEEEEANA